MQQIGFICDLKRGVNPAKSFASGWLDRAVPMAKFLNKFNIKLTIYSPSQIDPYTQTVNGYWLEDNGFVRVNTPIPKINGNWYMPVYDEQQRAGMTMTQLISLAKNNGIGIYPSNQFQAFVNDKYLAYEHLERIAPGLQPLTKHYEGSIQQIRDFTTQYPLVFMKPRYGGHGDRIFVIKHNDDKYLIDFYYQKQKETFHAASLTQCHSFISERTQGSPFIIQQGIATQKIQERTFDIRSMASHDGDQWRVMAMARVSQANIDVSNIAQGAFVRSANDQLHAVMPHPQAQQTLADIYALSRYLSRLLAQRLEEEIIEIAYDFVIDTQNQIKLIELNAAPMLMMPGLMADELIEAQPFSHIADASVTPQLKMAYRKTYHNIFALRREELVSYQQYTLPYANCLAEFLMTKFVAHQQQCQQQKYTAIKQTQT